MERRLAVQVQYPRVSYVDLFPLDGPHRSHRRLSPIEVGQRVAVVKLFLMRGKGGAEGDFTPERELHAFRIGGLPAEAEHTPVLTLAAEYDGDRGVHLSVAGAGIASQAVDVRVPRSHRPQPRRWWWLAVPVVLLLLGGGAFLTVRMIGSDTAGSGHTTSAETDRPDGTDSGVRESTAVEAAEPAPPPDPPRESAEDASADAAEDQAATPLPRNDVSIYFEPNRTRLTEAARRELDEVVAVLREHPEAPVSIVGHTALYGTEDGRLEISQGRAQAVAAYLRSLGWEAQTEPSIAWVGSQNPVTREQDEQERNRRVEITIGGDGAAP